jgi:DNA-directed RNA polymerase specialized sigma24 family protein
MVDQELLDIARRRVAERVDPRTLEAFQLTAVEGLSGNEAAARLRMKVTAVYMARSRVQKLLRQEIEKLYRAGCA